jgi:hypothetical protein
MKFSSNQNSPKNPSTVKNKKSYIDNSNLIIFTFITVFYPRIVCTLTGAPSILNFGHFATVTIALIVGLLTTQVKDKTQINIIWQLLLGILALFGAMLVSALVNHAGLVNVIFDFLILGEPFMFLLAIICLSLSPKRLKTIKAWILSSAFINFILAEIQKPLLQKGLLVAPNGMDATDGVQGVFFVSGAGGYISTGVSITAAIYFFVYFKKVPIIIRFLGLIGAIHHMLIADTKQVLLTSLVGWGILGLTKVHDLKKLLWYVLSIIIAISAFIWAAYNLEAFEVYKYWFTRDDIYQDSDGGWTVKIAGIRMVIDHLKSPLNWLFGLGPGHTLGRLGGWSIIEYWSILAPLGATAPPLYYDIWSFIHSNWIALTTTLYVPLFTWAGIWGDLGWFGLGVYLYVGYIVWHRLCLDDFTKFLILNVIVCGFFLTQMEEPGFMLSIAAFIGLRWQEQKQIVSNR